MKVPYLRNRQREEMVSLATEFSGAIATNLSPTTLNARLKSGWLNNLHPLFALLQLLISTRHNLNPSREFALQGAKNSNDGELFLEAMNSFHASPAVLKAMQGAHSNAIFSGFIAELRSDLLMVFVHGLMYSYRNAAINLRCSLEDIYRHLYYMDHPQEYMALKDGRETEYSMGISPQGFREYLKRSSHLKNFMQVNTKFAPKNKDDMDLFGINEELYGSLSAAVHGASEDWFAALQNAASLQQNLDKEQKFEDLCSKFSKMCVAFLISAHRDIFSSAGDYDKSIVLDLYTAKERESLRYFLNI